MGEAGLLANEDRVELVEGELVQLAPIGSGHAGCVGALTRLLVMAVRERAMVSVQNPVRLDEHSEPQPDFAVLAGRPSTHFPTGVASPKGPPLAIRCTQESAIQALSFARRSTVGSLSPYLPTCE